MVHGGIVSSYYGNGEGNSKNPVSYYFGKNQTKRVGQNYTPGGSGNHRAAEWKTTADETYDGGKADLLTITHARTESTIDIPNGPNNAVLQLPAGRYHLTFHGYSTASAQSSHRVELRQIKAATDDTLIIEATGYSRGANPARSTYQLLWSDLVVDGTEKFYFLFPVGGSNHRSHFLRVEKVV